MTIWLLDYLVTIVPLNGITNRSYKSVLALINDIYTFPYDYLSGTLYYHYTATTDSESSTNRIWIPIDNTWHAQLITGPGVPRDCRVRWSMGRDWRKRSGEIWSNDGKDRTESFLFSFFKDIIYSGGKRKVPEDPVCIRLLTVWNVFWLLTSNCFKG